MTEDDWAKVCADPDKEEVVTCDNEGDPFEVTLGGGTEESCLAFFDTYEVSASCEATYGEYKKCGEAIKDALRDDACWSGMPDECEITLDCWQYVE